MCSPLAAENTQFSSPSATPLSTETERCTFAVVAGV